MTTTQESARPLPLIGQPAGQAQASLTVRTLDEITRRVRATFGTEESR